MALNGSPYKISFKYTHKSSHREHRKSVALSEDPMRWVQFSASNSLCTCSPNTDAQERRWAEKHHPFEKWRLLSAVELLEMHNTEEAFCKSRVSFLFSKSKCPITSFSDTTHQTNRGSVLWHLITFIWTFRTPYTTYLLVDECK